MSAVNRSVSLLTVIGLIASSPAFAQSALSESDLDSAAASSASSAERVSPETLSIIKDHLAELEDQLVKAEIDLTINRVGMVAGIGLSAVMVYLLGRGFSASPSDINQAFIRAIGVGAASVGTVIGVGGTVYSARKISVNKGELEELSARIIVLKNKISELERNQR